MGGPITLSELFYCKFNISLSVASFILEIYGSKFFFLDITKFSFLYRSINILVFMLARVSSLKIFTRERLQRFVWLTKYIFMQSYLFLLKKLLNINPNLLAYESFYTIQLDNIFSHYISGILNQKITSLYLC